MTTYFVSSAGSNTSPYDTEAKAATALGTVIAAMAAGDIVKISSAHSENLGANTTYTLPATIGSQFLSVTFNGAGTGALATGGTVNTNGSFSLTINGYGYFYGVTFTAGTGSNQSSAQLSLCNNQGAESQIYESCTFYMNTTSTAPDFNIGPAASTGDRDSYCALRNCQVRFGSTSHSFNFRHGVFPITGLSFHASTSVPTVVFTSVTSTISLVDISASDLSVLTNTTLFDVGVNAPSRIVMKECKLPSGFTLTTGTPTGGPGSVELIMADCDSGDNHYKFTKVAYSGTVTAQNSIYADSSNGTDNLGWTLASNGNATFLSPLICPPISYWNATLSAMTTTVEAASNNVTFKDNELWQETLSKVTSGFPLGTWNVADRAADVFAAGANQTTSTKTWTGVPGTPVLQKLVSGSFTPAEVGPIRIRAYLGKASATAYISPKVL